MNSTISISVFASVLLLCVASEARVTRDFHATYLEAATAAGGCKDKEFLRKLELQYTACQATDEQFKELFKAYDTANESSCNPRTLNAVQTMWNLSGSFARELRAAGAPANNC